MDIKLTLKSNNRTLEISKYTSHRLINIDGIESGNIELNTVSNAQFDGSVVVSKRIQDRPISITCDYRGSVSKEVERQNLISFFSPKNKGVLIINYGEIERAIEYEVEDFNCKLNNIFETINFTADLLCPQPYWRDILESKINIALWRGMFRFPLIMPSTIIPHSGNDSVWKDLSGNLNNGLLSGFNFDASSGWTTEGLKFDSDSYVTLPSLELQEGTIQVNNQVVTFDKDTDYRTTSANSNIVSLNTTVDGIMDVELGGRTLKNEVANGNFNSNTVGWLPASSTISVSNNVLSINGNGIDNTPRASYDGVKLYTLGHKYYFRGTARVTTDSCRRLIHRVFGGAPSDTTIEYPIKDTWYTMSNVFDVITTPTSVQYFGHSYVDATTAVGKVMELKEVIAIDLTAMFGVGNEPSKEWCDANIQWFEGIKSVGESESNQIEILSVGKNLLKGLVENQEYIATTAPLILTDYIRVNKDKTHTLSAYIKDTITYTDNTGSAILRLDIYDENKILINNKGVKGTVTTNFTRLSSEPITLPVNAKYIRINFRHSLGDVGTAKNIQLEENNVMTPFEPFRSDTKTLTLTNPLRGLPNNVRDIAKENEVTRNVGKVVFNGGESWSYSKSSDPAVKFFTVMDLTASNTIRSVLSDNFVATYHIYGIADSYKYDGCWAYALGRIYISILKSNLTPYGFIDGNTGTYVTAFKAWLQANNTTVYYQLATPTTEILAQNLKLKSFSSGTLQVNTAIPPYLSASYPITLNGSIASNVSRIDIDNHLIETDLVEIYRVYNRILTTEEIARANTVNYLRGSSLLVDLNSNNKQILEEGIIMGLREPSLIVNALNVGDVESGMRIEFRALGTLTNPSILNIETQEFFKVNKSMVAGEVITVNTKVGSKKVTNYLNGIETNILNLIDLDSTFLQLKVGDNLLRYDADVNIDNLEVSIFYNPFYLGV